VALAGPAATKQRVQIDIKGGMRRTFALAPLEFGALEPDSGKLAPCNGEFEFPSDEIMRDGQQGWPKGCRAAAVRGKRGTLVLRYQYTWTEAGGPYNIATGTWKVVRGTGQYAGITGGGRIAQVGIPRGVWARYQGFLTSP